MDPTLMVVLVLGVCGAGVAWLLLSRVEAVASELERLDGIEDLLLRLDDLSELIEQRRLGEQLQSKLTEFTEGMARLSSTVAELQQSSAGMAPVGEAGTSADLDLAGIVRRHLERDGFETVNVLSETGKPGADGETDAEGEAGAPSGRVTFEGRRGGVVHKGHLIIEAGQVVDQKLRSAYSSFP